MKVLVIGGSGLVGWNVLTLSLRAGLDVAYTVNSNGSLHPDAPEYRLDVRDEAETARTVSAVNPDAVVHAAGMADADACERAPDRSEAVNVDGTANVASACEAVGASLLFFSSSMVFDGQRTVYHEDSERAPISTYGEHKVAAEDIVDASSVDSIVARIDQPYCWPTDWQAETFVSWVYERLERNRPFSVFVDWFNTPIFMDDLTTSVLALLQEGCTGTYHVVGSQYVSRHDWARTMAEELGFDPELIRKGNSSEADLPATRPSANLSNDRITDELGLGFRSLREAIAILDERRQCGDFEDGRYHH